MRKQLLAVFSLGLLLLFGACSRSNNVLLGRVEATVGTHAVVVTDCYRTSVPQPQKVSDTEFQFKPCRDAEVVIRNEELIVNAKNYGRLQPKDAVTVDHGKVLINERAATVLARN
ncbi:MAG: hypothetical protein HYR56_32725 [Acidobacteria bacterium]|nr:hypothetical protein [Acidobacteriota bacterium]MBI3426134.1 hypothetical protein [Acidobacteriota bacterium]